MYEKWYEQLALEILFNPFPTFKIPNGMSCAGRQSVWKSKGVGGGRRLPSMRADAMLSPNHNNCQSQSTAKKLKKIIR